MANDIVIKFEVVEDGTQLYPDTPEFTVNGKRKGEEVSSLAAKYIKQEPLDDDHLITPLSEVHNAPYVFGYLSVNLINLFREAWLFQFHENWFF